MPIPDTIAADTDYQEQRALELKKQDAETERVHRICNALLRKQINCKNLCMACKEGCEELKAWEALEEK